MPINYTQEDQVQVPTLKRLTTVYIDLEDRMQLTGELEDGASVVLWMTQRLLSRLLPHLLDLLQKQTAIAVGSGEGSVQTEMVQMFSQQAARAQVAPQQPVRQTQESAAWLVMSVDVTSTKPGDPGGLISRLIFKGGGDCAAIPLPATQLRQWMNILHDQWLKAGWPMGLWPDWVKESKPLANEQQIQLH